MAILSDQALKRREQIGWCMYDWADSAFSTTVVTVFFGPYITTIAKNCAGALGYIYPFGIKIAAGSFFPYLISLSVLLQVLILPFLSAVADHSGRKKEMLVFFAYLGSLSTLAMYFIRDSNYLFGGLLFILANLCFGASNVAYNAFLPEIAGPDERDKISSWGWATGYLGGGLLLALNLLLFLKSASLGISQGLAVRIGFASAGFWWAVFTLAPALSLKNMSKNTSTGFSSGLKQLKNMLSRLSHFPRTILFLIAYLLYNDGVQTVIAMSSQFGQEVLGLPISTLLTVILMVQFIAFFGSIFFNHAAKRFGAKRAILTSLVIWICSLIFAHSVMKNAFHYYILGSMIALVLGGTQALSRSVYSHIIPKGEEAEYFSIYELSEKGTSWIGPLLFGLILQFSGNYRTAILSLIVFFVAGFLLLMTVDLRKAARDAGNEAPIKV